jgi:hypothetical protein
VNSKGTRSKRLVFPPTFRNKYLGSETATITRENYEEYTA